MDADIEPTDDEKKLLAAARRYGRVRRITELVEKMAYRKFGEPQDIMRILVNQNSKKWDLQTTKGDCIEV